MHLSRNAYIEEKKRWKMTHLHIPLRNR
jgi:hypothetical protein